MPLIAASLQSCSLCQNRFQSYRKLWPTDSSAVWVARADTITSGQGQTTCCGGGGGVSVPILRDSDVALQMQLYVMRLAARSLQVFRCSSSRCSSQMRNNAGARMRMRGFMVCFSFCCCQLVGVVVECCHFLDFGFLSFIFFKKIFSLV